MILTNRRYGLSVFPIQQKRLLQEPLLLYQIRYSAEIK